ncbi:MAG: rod shape-determining protein MreC [Thermoleophilia bacterium]
MGTHQDSPLARRRATARRGVLAAMVVACLLLFTAYSTEGEDGPLHGVQAAVGSLVAPLQEGTSRAVRPFRDAWSWTASLIDARDRAAQLEDVNTQLRTALAQNQFDASELQRVRRLVGVGDELSTDYTTVPSDIISSSPSPWVRRATINHGSDDGILVNSPVLAAGSARGLAGLITRVSSHTAVVTFLTEPRSSVGVLIDQANARGILSPSVPGEMQVTGVPLEKPVSNNQLVVTAGSSGTSLPSVYPRGIPVGQVKDAGGLDTDVEQRIQVVPFVQPDDLDFVVVLAPKSERAIRRARGER